MSQLVLELNEEQCQTYRQTSGPKDIVSLVEVISDLTAAMSILTHPPPPPQKKKKKKVIIIIIIKKKSTEVIAVKNPVS